MERFHVCFLKDILDVESFFSHFGWVVKRASKSHFKLGIRVHKAHTSYFFFYEKNTLLDLILFVCFWWNSILLFINPYSPIINNQIPANARECYWVVSNDKYLVSSWGLIPVQWITCQEGLILLSKFVISWDAIHGMCINYIIYKHLLVFIFIARMACS